MLEYALVKQLIDINLEHLSKPLNSPSVKPTIYKMCNYLDDYAIHGGMSQLFSSIRVVDDASEPIVGEIVKMLGIEVNDTCYDFLSKGIRHLKVSIQQCDLPTLPTMKVVNGKHISTIKSTVEVYKKVNNGHLNASPDDVLNMFLYETKKTVADVEDKQLPLESVGFNGGRYLLSNDFDMNTTNSKIDTFMDTGIESYVRNDCDVVTIKIDGVDTTVYKINGCLYDRYGMPLSSSGLLLTDTPVLWSMVKLPEEVTKAVVIQVYNNLTIVPVSQNNRLILPDGKITGRPLSLTSNNLGNCVDVLNGYIILNTDYNKELDVEYFTCLPSELGSKVYTVNSLFCSKEFPHDYRESVFKYDVIRTSKLSILAHKLTIDFYKQLGIVNMELPVVEPDLISEVKTNNGTFLTLEGTRYSNLSLEEYSSNVAVLGDIIEEPLSFEALQVIGQKISGVAGTGSPLPNELFSHAALGTPFTYTNKVNHLKYFEDLTDIFQEYDRITTAVPHVNFISLTISDEYKELCINHTDYVTFSNRISFSTRYNNMPNYEHRNMINLSNDFVDDNRYVNKELLSQNELESYWSNVVPVVSIVGTKADDVRDNLRYVFVEDCMNTVPYDLDVVMFNEFGDTPFVRYYTNERLTTIYEDEITLMCKNKYGELVIVIDGVAYKHYIGALLTSVGTSYEEFGKTGHLPLTNERLSLVEHGICVEPFSGEQYLYDSSVGRITHRNKHHMNMNIGLANTEQNPILDFIEQTKLLNYVTNDTVHDTVSTFKLEYE